MSYLAHITLHTGHIRGRSPRNDVADYIIDSLGPIVAKAESGEPTDLIMVDETWVLRRLDATDSSRHTRQWTLGPSADEPIVMMAVAMKSAPGAHMWRHIHRTVSGLATKSDDLPPAPWLAAYLDLKQLAFSAPAAARWLGDAERCIAWAWIEHCYRK